MNAYDISQYTKNEFEKTNVPSGIINYLEKRSGIKKISTSKRYSVSELITCIRKSYYKTMRFEEEIKNNVTLDRLWSTTRGDLLHQITYAYRWRELDVEYPIHLKNGKIVNLVGRLDMYDWENRTIIDLKTTKSVNWQIKNHFLPKVEHILQVQCYGTIFSQLIPIENLCLVYVDMNDLVAFRVKNVDMTSWIVKRIRELEECFENKIPPQMEPSGLCKFCKYQLRCDKDNESMNSPQIFLEKGDKN